jgi:hypothetical protein
MSLLDVEAKAQWAAVEEVLAKQASPDKEPRVARAARRG